MVAPCLALWQWFDLYLFMYKAFTKCGVNTFINIRKTVAETLRLLLLFFLNSPRRLGLELNSQCRFLKMSGPSFRCRFFVQFDCIVFKLFITCSNMSCMQGPNENQF